MDEIYVNADERIERSRIDNTGEDVIVSFDDAVFMMTDLIGHTTLTLEQRNTLLRLADDIIHSHFEFIVNNTCNSCKGKRLEEICHHCRVFRELREIYAQSPSDFFLKNYLS